MEKFDLVLENTFLKAKTTILEESASVEEAKRYEVVLTEAASSLQKVKDFVKQHKGKLGALAAAALAGGAYAGARSGMMGQGAQEAVKDFEQKAVETGKEAVEQAKSLGEKLTGLFGGGKTEQGDNIPEEYKAKVSQTYTNMGLGNPVQS